MGGAECPSKQYEIEQWIELRDRVYSKEWVWHFPLPRSDAANWHCKYKVMANLLFLRPLQPDEKIMLDFTLEGFENSVYLIVQKRYTFVDVHRGQSSDEVQRIVTVKHGTRVFIPPEEDVYISFAPISNSDGREMTSMSGKFAFTAQLKKITIKD